MFFYMIVICAFMTKLLGTFGAFIGPLFGMSPNMCLQVPTASKIFIAKSAFIWFLSSMNSHVLFEIIPEKKL